jgi:hypothetical protein
MLRRVAVGGSLAVSCMLVGGGAAGSAVAPAVFHHPRISTAPVKRSAAGWTSSNWSGYAITGSTYSSISGQWTVPAVAASRKATYSSNWIGIDGYSNSDLIQTGTESDYYNGSAHYDAWWEILPAAETVIPSISVKPGDTIKATITKGSGSTWTITISDGSQSFTTNQTYTGPQTSAEWIEEAPSIGGRVAPLANFGTATFDPGTVNGGNPLLTASESGAMVQKNVQVATPSDPDNDTDGFNVAYGSSAPAPPSS